MTNSTHRAVWGVQAASVAALAAFLVHRLVPFDGVPAALADRGLYAAVVAAALALCAARVATVPRERAGWSLLTAAVACWTLGELAGVGLAPDGAAPAPPSLADALGLAFYPLAYAGFVALVRARVVGIPTAVWLDGLAAGFAVAVVSAAVLLEAVLGSTSGEPASTVAISVAYPLAAAVLLSLVVGTFALVGWRPGRSWWLIGGALAVVAVAEAVFVYQVASGVYVEGWVVDALWPAALLLLAHSAWTPDEGRVRVDVSGRPLLAVPVVAAGTAVAVLLLDRLERFHPLTLLLATATLVAVVVRLCLTLRENGRLLALTRVEADTDPLTGLPNRRRLLEDLEGAAEEARRGASRVLVLFDLDGFKPYNDAFGHLAGDALLQRLGSRLGAVPGRHGRAYRLGGDEFCLLADASPQDADALVEAACAALAERGEGFAVGTSFGAAFLAADTTDARTALRVADERLYAQKHAKRWERDRPHDMLLQALYEREPELHTHLEGVAALAEAVGQALGVEGAELRLLRRAAQLHDIGKLAIPDAILHKADALDEAEWLFIRQHTVIGQRILAASPALHRVGEIVRSTHERWDGSGYPDGLAGEAIPLAARIILACDAFDAMSAEREYDCARPLERVIAELERAAGRQLDPRVVAALVGTLRAHSIAA